MTYAISLSKEASKELERLDRKTEQRIQRRLDELALNPYDRRISNEVKMEAGQRYSRVGDPGGRGTTFYYYRTDMRLRPRDRTIGGV